MDISVRDIIKQLIITLVIGIVIFLVVLLVVKIHKKSVTTVKTCSTQNVSQKKEIDILKNQIDFLRSRYQKLERHDVIVTCYSSSPEETDSTPFVTALNERPVAGWTCAVSRDLDYLLGAEIYIEGIGVRYVNDLMNPRFTKRVDIFASKQFCKKFGLRKTKIIYIGKY